MRGINAAVVGILAIVDNRGRVPRARAIKVVAYTTSNVNSVWPLGKQSRVIPSARSSISRTL